VAGEAFDVYFRDILQCIQSLYGNPEFSSVLVFAPERHYLDADQTNRAYHDMHTGKWWWETQVSPLLISRVLLISSRYNI
jgi:Plavaka transposase